MRYHPPPAHRVHHHTATLERYRHVPPHSVDAEHFCLSLAHAKNPPLLASISVFHSRAIQAVTLVINPPHLVTISVFISRAIQAVTLVINPPPATFCIFNGRAI